MQKVLICFTLFFCQYAYALIGLPRVSSPPERVSLSDIEDTEEMKDGDFTPEVEESPSMSRRLVERYPESETSSDTSSSNGRSGSSVCGSSSSSERDDVQEEDVMLRYNQNLFECLRNTPNLETARLQRRLIFYFDGQTREKEQLEIALRIESWLLGLDRMQADDLYRILLDNAWTHVLPQVLRIVPYSPNPGILVSALRRGAFRIANQILDNDAAFESLREVKVELDPSSFFLPGRESSSADAEVDFEYMYLNLEVLTTKLRKLGWLKKKDATRVLDVTRRCISPRTLSPRGASPRRLLSPRSVQVLRRSYQQRSTSVTPLSSLADKGDVTKISRSVGSSPREDDN